MRLLSLFAVLACPSVLATLTPNISLPGAPVPTGGSLNASSPGLPTTSSGTTPSSVFSPTQSGTPLLNTSSTPPSVPTTVPTNVSTSTIASTNTTATSLAPTQTHYTFTPFP